MEPLLGYNLNISLARITSDDDPYNQTSINMYVPDIRKPGTVTFEQTANPTLTTSNPAYATFIKNKPDPDEVLITGPAYPGQLTITRLDTVARIVAGTYEFKAKQLGGAVTVSVTEGRFDLHY